MHSTATHDQAAHAGDLQQALGGGQRARRVADRAHRIQLDDALRRLRRQRLVRGAWDSAIVDLRGQRGLDPVGEQQFVDAAMQLLEGRRADVAEIRDGRR